MGNEAIKEIGAACQVSSSRPLQAIGAFPKVHVMTLPRFLCGGFCGPPQRAVAERAPPKRGSGAMMAFEDSTSLPQPALREPSCPLLLISRVRDWPPDCCCMCGTNKAGQHHMDLPL